MLLPRPLVLLQLTGLLLSTAFGLDIKGKVEWNELCPDSSSLGSARVLLDSGSYWSAGIRRDGSFVIPDVGSGVHVLSVLAHDHQFDQFRVFVPASGDEPTIQPYVAGTPLSPIAPSPVVLSHPITLVARRKNQYFVPHQGFNIVGFFKNPMMIMMVVVGGMVLTMPMLMKNMDPDTQKDFQERQAAMTKMQQNMANMDFSSGLANLLGGNAPQEETVAPPPDKKIPVSGTRNRGKGKRR